MDLLSLELRYLRYFAALAEELHFRRAAERLGITPPALSMTVKKLEDILETRLCDRDSARVHLTVAGETLARMTRAFLPRVKESVEAVREAARGHRGRLRVGVPARLAESFIPDVLKTYHERYPRVDVSLVEIDMEEEQFKTVQEGRAHVSFAYEFQLPNLSKRFDRLLVSNAPLRATMAVHHPLVAQEEISLADLAQYPILASAAHGSQVRNMRAIFRRKKLETKPFKINAYHAFITMLAAGEGVSILPGIRLIAFNPRLALRPIKDNIPGLRMQVYAIWEKKGVSPHIRNFVELLRKNGVQHD